MSGPETKDEKKQRANYLTTVQAYNLEVAAYPLVKATWQLGFGFTMSAVPSRVKIGAMLIFV